MPTESKWRGFSIGEKHVTSEPARNHSPLLIPRKVLMDDSGSSHDSPREAVSTDDKNLENAPDDRIV